MTNTLGGGVAQRLCNGLPRDGPGFDSRWERCKNQQTNKQLDVSAFGFYGNTLNQYVFYLF